MRDSRFVALHRGGSLDPTVHRVLAAWAARCAEHVLPLIGNCAAGERPRQAIAAAQAWAKNEVTVGAARRAAVASHAAAREMTDRAATAVARAAGHAAATAHMADHCLRTACYALKAVQAAHASMEAERAWQEGQLPDEVRDWVLSALGNRFTNVPPSAGTGHPSNGRAGLATFSVAN